MENCLFCKIATGEIPTNLLYKDEHMVAFADISPRAPVHILIIPQKHIASLAELTAEDIPLIGAIQYLAKQLAEQHGIAESGYRVLTNCRGDSGQEVHHLHYHLVGGTPLGMFLQT